MTIFDINAGTTLVVRLASGRLASGVTVSDLGVGGGARYLFREQRTGETLELNSNFDVPLDWKEVDVLLNPAAPHQVPSVSDELTDLLGITPANVVEAALLAALRRAVGVEP